MISATTTHSDPLSCSELSEDADPNTLRATQLFREARGKLAKVAELRTCALMEKGRWERSASCD